MDIALQATRRVQEPVGRPSGDLQERAVAKRRATDLTGADQLDQLVLGGLATRSLVSPALTRHPRISS